MGEGLDDRGYAALAQFRRTLRIFLAFSEDAARQAGLTPQQHQAILAIRGLAPITGMTINELSEQLLLKPQTTVELADRLAAAGLVERQRDEVDRRRVFLQLTPKALEILEQLSAAHLAQIGRDAPHLIELLEQVAKRGRRP
ncbi:MarR family winged helix-turn-helix transcriptional regulator [Chelatococcus reniformis]|uniref:MarR family transcriptional regulator n=1 Tax=Chelatococcus reniformis TaxID=1494448 RepID=A0A916UKG0_9HYPH|nr:MarR family transcriptional regulator [Chelatococcus reniformis]GGC75543.1 MarR family transcriptional regulator [Chelatococcus reniformis]